MSPTMTTSQLRDILENLPSDPQERKELYNAARDLMVAAEAPRDTHHRIFISWLRPAVQIGIDLGVFRTLATQPTRFWTIAELANATGAEDALLRRVLRTLAAHGTLQQVSPTNYRANNVTETLAHEDAQKMSSAQLRFTGPFMHALPLHLARTKYRDANDVSDSAFQAGHETKQTPYAWLSENPVVAKLFFDMMPVQRAGQLCWTRQPKFMECLLKTYFGMSAEDIANRRIAFVDVGGGSGHQCIAVRNNLNQLKGRIVLQDLEWSTKPAEAAAELHSRNIEIVTHDFTKPQPAMTRGAKAYYLRNVLHNWDDEACVPILRHLRDALADDSVIVLDEMVVPEMNAGMITVNYDMIMMGFASKQRTEAAWRQLLQRAGLEIVDVRCYDQDSNDCLLFIRLSGCKAKL